MSRCKGTRLFYIFVFENQKKLFSCFTKLRIFDGNSQGDHVNGNKEKDPKNVLKDLY